MCCDLGPEDSCQKISSLVCQFICINKLSKMTLDFVSCISTEPQVTQVTLAPTERHSHHIVHETLIMVSLHFFHPGFW